MNERIRELQKQSSIEQWDPDDGCYRYILNPEKFAHLIVQKCAEIIETHYEPVYDGTELYKYFGMKS